MKLAINGEETDCSVGMTVIELIEMMGAKRESVAVMVNGAVVRRESLESIALADGDCVEILTFAGGGSKGRWG